MKPKEITQKDYCKIENSPKEPISATTCQKSYNKEIAARYANVNSFKLVCPSIVELSNIILDQFNTNDNTQQMIIDFNQKHRYEFKNSLSFQLGRSMIRHCDPKTIIEWNNKAKENQIMNNNDAETTSKKTKEIVNEFILTKSQKAMERITVFRDHEFFGKVFKNVRVRDYSIVCNPSTFEEHHSLLFEPENEGIVMQYYFDFIYYFPVTRLEFEKILFFFVIHMLNEPASFDRGNIESARLAVNNIIRMRYIDITDRYLLSLLHIIFTDNGLCKSSEELYNVLETLNEMNLDQFRLMGS